jgi:hypothetical protein
LSAGLQSSFFTPEKDFPYGAGVEPEARIEDSDQLIEVK